jgi:hypothetical protein
MKNSSSWRVLQFESLERNHVDKKGSDEKKKRSMQTQKRQKLGIL